jgi:hypothetical protein
MPASTKSAFLGFLEATGLGGIKLSVSAENIAAIGYNP